ncbi:glucuronate isomerase [Cerasicoccus arenae]|uniref:Uronate isomerase n=1 Tax=Cerasicoccus arenae TaxID=424488 RepID=A0A8J3DES6_9BACT|nr:glucuronate isomerase [Cerasicoccus arenae]MBK1857013.1 glucuronate isomerase [Cerasicoccus arenae]GHB90379.1 uronate isomerase [Cerasicoccus arenae]
MPKFIHEDFLLQSETAKRLYHEVAKDEPIIDYHCHLPPEDVANDRRFRNLADIWLGGDHYKWRALRTNGIDESLITGDAGDYDKFLAWCKTVPDTLRNPLYHWSHLEMVRYFGIEELINEKTAPAIWERANALLAQDDYSANGILKKFQVKVVCTTDDPTDELLHHQAAAKDPNVTTAMYPTFRPDKALKIDDTEAFNAWCDKLTAVSGIDTGSFQGLKDALKQRHDFFHSLGGRLSDHGLEKCFDDFVDDARAASIFDHARGGSQVAPEQASEFASNLMVYFGQLDAEKGWTKQLHVGAMRNNNTRLFKKLGPDTGFDSIGDYSQGRALSNYLNRLDLDDTLPKVVIYNLNPSDNYLMATMAGNFQDGSIAGKIQFGSGWWFLDQKEAMEWQMNALSNLGLLSRFVGMLTDSRSFLSYPRHEYFRRILCNLIGNDVEKGLIPDEWELYSPMVRKICYGNAANFFGFQIPA